jgi:hypothetical protein
MMQPAFDLSPRQAARVLEQALRTRAPVEVETRQLPEDSFIRGVLEQRDGHTLELRVDSIPPGVWTAGLTGAFCEVRIRLFEHVYLFTTFIPELLEEARPLRLRLAVPEVIQVANRRRFERLCVPSAAQVHIQARQRSQVHVGLLADVSASGLSCSIPTPEHDDALLVGDPLRVAFELPGCDERFELPVLVCNKALSRDRQLLTIGLEFDVSAGDTGGTANLERLQAVLCEMISDPTGMDDRP